MTDDNHSSEPLHAEKSPADDAEMQENESDGILECAEQEMRTSPIETLASEPIHAEVPKEYKLRRNESKELKSKVQGSHQEALSNVTAQAHVQNQLQSPAFPPPSSSPPSSNTQEQTLIPVAKSSSLCVAVVNQQNTSDHISVFSQPIVRRHASDDYNWRKYGQKEVKSPLGSRSYYRCTCTQCYAKKIECCDQNNLIMEVIYKGEHNHDPPKKVNCGKESKVALSVTPISVISNTSQPVQELMDTDPSTSSKVVKEGMPAVAEVKRQYSIDSDGDELKDKEEHTDTPEPKQRAKKNNSAHSASLSKTAKRPKLVVRTAGDMGITGDGYRWRKYGQKMVKGNPHPRNYYRCTSTGCPVRKHIERAADNSTGVTITYTGTHDHETPLSKKQHGTSSRLRVAASLSKSQAKKKAEPLSNKVSPSQFSVLNTEGGELTGEVNGEKPALLSIGI